MPTTRYAAATKNAAAKDCRPLTRYPVMTGAAMPEIWFDKFMMPPTEPTLSPGAMSDGIDQPTGAAADNPPIETLIQKSA